MGKCIITRKGGTNSNAITLGTVPYINCHTSGIITDIHLSANYKIEVKFDAETYNNDECIFGTIADHSATHLTLYNNKYYIGCGSYEFSFGTYSSGDHIFIYNDELSRCVFDGTVVRENVNVTVDTNKTYTIGCRTSKTSNVFQGKLYYLKFTDKTTGDVVCNFIPIYQQIETSYEKGNIGFTLVISGCYDTINNKYYKADDWDYISGDEG